MERKWGEFQTWLGTYLREKLCNGNSTTQSQTSCVTALHWNMRRWLEGRKPAIFDAPQARYTYAAFSETMDRLRQDFLNVCVPQLVQQQMRLRQQTIEQRGASVVGPKVIRPPANVTEHQLRLQRLQSLRPPSADVTASQARVYETAVERLVAQYESGVAWDKIEAQLQPVSDWTSLETSLRSQYRERYVARKADDRTHRPTRLEAALKDTWGSTPYWPLVQIRAQREGEGMNQRQGPGEEAAGTGSWLQEVRSYGAQAITLQVFLETEWPALLTAVVEKAVVAGRKKEETSVATLRSLYATFRQRFFPSGAPVVLRQDATSWLAQALAAHT